MGKQYSIRLNMNMQFHILIFFTLFKMVLATIRFRLVQISNVDQATLMSEIWTDLLLDFSVILILSMQILAFQCSEDMIEIQYSSSHKTVHLKTGKVRKRDLILPSQWPKLNLSASSFWSVGIITVPKTECNLVVWILHQSGFWILTVCTRNMYHYNGNYKISQSKQKWILETIKSYFC